MIISNWEKPFALHGLYKHISALYELKPRRFSEIAATQAHYFRVVKKTPVLHKVPALIKRGIVLTLSSLDLPL